MKTGSIKLCIVVHGINNGLAVLIGRFTGAEGQVGDGEVSLLAQAGLGAIGLLVTVATAWLAVRTVNASDRRKAAEQ